MQYSDGLLKTTLTYNHSIQDNQLTVVITPPTNLFNTFMMKVSSVQFMLDPLNAELLMYPDDVYM
jgi:hypothetical protein